MAADKSFDEALLVESAGVVQRPCLDKLENRLNDTKALWEEARKFDQQRIVTMIGR